MTRVDGLSAVPKAEVGMFGFTAAKADIPHWHDCHPPMTEMQRKRPCTVKTQFIRTNNQLGSRESYGSLQAFNKITT